MEYVIYSYKIWYCNSNKVMKNLYFYLYGKL